MSTIQIETVLYKICQSTRFQSIDRDPVYLDVLEPYLTGIDRVSVVIVVSCGSVDADMVLHGRFTMIHEWFVLRSSSVIKELGISTRRMCATVLDTDVHVGIKILDRYWQ